MIRWRNEKKWQSGANEEINNSRMEEDMDIMFNAVAKNYPMASEYKNTRNILLKFGKFCDRNIWKNFTYFIDWIERSFPKEKVFKIMRKSYHLEDNILYRIQKSEDDVEQPDSDSVVKESKTIETWLMSNIFRYLENPNKEKYCNEQKYTGKIKFTKCIASEYCGEYIDWTPGSQVDDIRIEVFIDDEMQIPRRYEWEHGWKDKWTTEKFPLNILKSELPSEAAWETKWYYIYEINYEPENR